MNTRFKAVIATLAGASLMTAVACGGGATATPLPTPTEPPPATLSATPTGVAPVDQEMMEVEAPVEKVEILIGESFPVQYMVRITSGLPSGCAVYDATTFEIDGKNVNVAVTNLVPADPNVACTMIYGYHDSTVNLGPGLDPGETYTVIVNGQTTNAFTVETPGGPAMTIKPSPIEGADLTIDEGEYILTVISRLPLGSTCSKFYGYDVDYRSAPEILVTVRHTEVVEENLPCTGDLPVVVTEIPLGTAPMEGEGRTVTVNGQASVAAATAETESGQTGGEGVPEGMEEVSAPIETVELVIGAAALDRYNLEIVSGLPSGCAEFHRLGLEQDGTEIDVTVTNLLPTASDIACAAVYGYHDSTVGLGGKLKPGETYTVRVNGQVTNAFTVPDTDTPMAVKNSPIEEATIAPADDPLDGYTLTVVSRLPLGSTCSKFFGYDVARRSGPGIQVTVKHLEVTEKNVPCSRDLPAVVTEIPLGTEFTPGETYSVTVNGDTKAVFTAE